MKKSVTPQLNISILSGTTSMGNQFYAGERLREDIGALKLAVLYGEDIELVSPTVHGWRSWLRFEDFDTADPKMRDLLLAHFFDRVSGFHAKHGGSIPTDAKDKVASVKQYLQHAKGSRAVHKQSPPDFLVETWSMMARFYEAKEVPDLPSIRRLMDCGRLSLVDPFDVSILPSDDYVRSVIRFDEDRLLQPARHLAALRLRLEHVLASPEIFPIFDRAIGAIVSGRPAPAQARMTVGPLAGRLLAHLPAFQNATLDEVIDIRTELKDSIRRFQVAVASMAAGVAGLSENDFAAAAEEIWLGQVLPGLQEINDSIQENGYLRQLATNVLTKPEGMIAGGAAASAILFGAAANMNAAAIISGGIMGTVPVAKAVWEKVMAASRIRRHKFFLIHQLSNRVR